jgi:small subunit ribosomal protein S17
MAKTLVGKVSSAKADKTIVITVHTRKTHPLYKKQYSVTTKFMAHDENNECKAGDKVVIEETRPISARKRYKLKEILERAKLTKEDLGAIEKSTEDAEEEKE